MMKKLILILFVSLSMFVGFAQANSVSESFYNAQFLVTVPIQPGASLLGAYAYGINPLYVHSGTWVLWVNYDYMAHSATSSYGVWDTGILLPGQSYQVFFTVPGYYPYFCRVHGAYSMNGQIIVIP